MAVAQNPATIKRWGMGHDEWMKAAALRGRPLEVQTVLSSPAAQDAEGKGG